MRLALAILLIGLASPALAAKHRPPEHVQRTDEPKPLGVFENWTAAEHLEGGQTVCYAFTRAQKSVPRLPGRGDVVLTVAERPSGRDAVAISAGYAFPPAADVRMRIDRHEEAFYTSQRSAFARNGHAAVSAFRGASEAVLHAPGPHGHGTVADTFSLRGFSAAYAEIMKACPAR